MNRSPLKRNRGTGSLFRDQQGQPRHLLAQRRKPRRVRQPLRSHVLAQQIVVPRLASLGTTPSQGPRPSRGPRRGVEDLEAAREQFREIVADLSGENVEPDKTRNSSPDLRTLSLLGGPPVRERDVKMIGTTRATESMSILTNKLAHDFIKAL